MAEQVFNPAIEPVFDPEHVGASLTRLQEQLPIRSVEMMGSVVGDLTSRRRGNGYERDGLRDYEFGDDPRHIDWVATARKPDGIPMVREHYADITPNLWIVTDMLGERHQQNPGPISEQILALSAITALMRIAHVNGMPTAVLASDGHKLTLKQRTAASGRSYMLKTAKQLAAAIPEAQTDKKRKRSVRLPERPTVYLSDMLQYAADRCMDSMVAVVSDLRDVDTPDDDEHGWQKPLQLLARNRNELLTVELTNPDDVALPERITRLVTPAGVIWVGPAERQKYAADAAARQADIVDNLAKVRAHHIRLTTTNPRWLTSMREQLRSHPKTR